MFFAYIDPGTGMTVLSSGSFLLTVIFGLLGVFAVHLKRLWNFLGKNKKTVIIVLLAASILCSLAAWKLMSGTVSKFNNKIVILGFDGLSPEIIEPMMREGRLPNFSRLANDGSYSRLRTTDPSQSPVAWTGFATGKNPGKTGLVDFIVRDPKNYRLSLSISDLSGGSPRRPNRATSFWQYLSDSGTPSIILGCPATFPPDKFNGRMISGMGVPDILGTEGTFTLYTSERSPGDIYSGGKIVHINRSGLIVSELTGPKVAPLLGKPDNLKVPFKVTLDEKNGSAVIEFQKNRIEIRQGQWSGWNEVTFKSGMFRTIKGIVKFYLIETGPDFKLYASPINLDPRAPFFSISYPSGYSAELADKFGFYYTQGMPMDTWAVNEKVLTEEPLLQIVDEVFRERKAQQDMELAKLKSGVLFSYYEATDIIQHMFWRYRDPKHPLHEKNSPEKYAHVIEQWYQNMDKVLGEVMGKLGKDDTLMVLSDHGFNTFRRAAHINSWLRENGYLQLKDEYALSGAELLADVDWSRTKAYAIGFGAIYINEEGREKNGIVKKEEVEQLKQEILKKLGSWKDDKYGEHVISKVYDGRAIFKGEYAASMPDLYIGFNIGYRASWQTALGAAPEGLIEDNLKKWSGDHLFDPALIPGVIFMSRKISKPDPGMYDVTPTILKAAGFTMDRIKEFDFDGKPLF